MTPAIVTVEKLVVGGQDLLEHAELAAPERRQIPVYCATTNPSSVSPVNGISDPVKIPWPRLGPPGHPRIGRQETTFKT